MDKSNISKPNLDNQYAQKELDKAEKKFDEFNDQVKQMTNDRMNAAPKLETEQQTKLSSREIQNNNNLYLKPARTMYRGTDPKTKKDDVFDEKFRKDWEYKKEYVNFTAENKEIIGEKIEMWTKPFPGVPAEFWEVPANKPIWGPRYLAEQIKNCTYHRFSTQDSTMARDGMGSYYGALIVDNTINRLDAHPVSDRKSVFMGASNF